MRTPLLLALTALISLSSCKRSTTAVDLNTNQEAQQSALAKAMHLDEGWYGNDPILLKKQLDENFDMAIRDFYVEADPNAVKVIVAPHAGMQYSGLCAATAYQTLLPNKNLLASGIKNTKIKHVIILAPDHVGIACPVGLPHYDAYTTPLGSVPVNVNAVNQLKELKCCQVQEHAHNKEHAVEMQLPFLQYSIESFSITPLIIGTIDQYDTNALIEKLTPLITEDTLVVVSSDFTHHGQRFHYNVFPENVIDHVRALDSLALEALMQQSFDDFNGMLGRTQATICGQFPIKVLLSLLQKKALGSLESRLCCYYTSAHAIQTQSQSGKDRAQQLLAKVDDNAGRESVSYAGVIFTAQKIKDMKKENQLTGYEKRSLLASARHSLENELGGNKHNKDLYWPVISPSLEQPCGTFVTLHDAKNQLRGCIGRVVSYNPLYQTVQEMALAAALKDGRFSPLTAAELPSTSLSISILSQPTRVASLAEITIGKHGIILNKFREDGTLQTSAVFLPQVPQEMGWDLLTTLTQLSIKAGLQEDGWQNGCELQAFEGYEIKEHQ